MFTSGFGARSAYVKLCTDNIICIINMTVIFGLCAIWARTCPDIYGVYVENVVSVLLIVMRYGKIICSVL
jgi:hypothetical protein